MFERMNRSRYPVDRAGGDKKVEILLTNKTTAGILLFSHQIIKRRGKAKSAHTSWMQSLRWEQWDTLYYYNQKGTFSRYDAGNGYGFEKSKI